MQYSLLHVKPFIGIPVNRDFPWQTTMAIARTVGMLEQKGRAYGLEFVVNGSIIHRTRSLVTTRFLKTDCTHLVCIDSDISWEPEVFFRLLCLGTVMDVVGAAYRAKQDPATYLVNIGLGKLAANEHGCLPINGMGLGFTIIKREVIECLAKKAPKVIDDNDGEVAMIFRTEIQDTPEGKVFVGEDICFFRDCTAAGAGVWVDPSMKLGHVGAKEFSGSFLQALQQVDANGNKKVDGGIPADSSGGAVP